MPELGHRFPLVATGLDHKAVRVAGSDAIDTVHYDIYECEGIVGGPEYVVISLDLFERMVAEINAIRLIDSRNSTEIDMGNAISDPGAALEPDPAHV